MDDVFQKTIPKKTKLSLSDMAYIELKRRILENELLPGSQLMESECAELLNISRTPAREAMTRLELEGLVEIRARHGMMVKPISVSDLTEICTVLSSLESTAAWHAAQLDHPPEVIKALRQSVTQIDQALAAKDLKVWATSDEDFRRLLVFMSGNVRLIQLVDRFMSQIHRVRMLTLTLRPIPTRSTEDHASVLAAIETKDGDTARRIHRIHCEEVGKMLIELLKKHNLTQF